MRVLVYGDIGGSGGYVRYCQGLFGDKTVPDDLDLIFVCAPSFYERIRPLSERIRVIPHAWPASSSRLRRYLWQLLVYPYLVRQVRPTVEFYPSGQLRVYGRHATTVATCHNLVLFDPVEMQRLAGRPEQHSFAIYRDRQARSFRAASGVIFLSKHSRQVVVGALPGVRRQTVVAHGLDEAFRRPTPRAYDCGPVTTVLYVSSIWPYKYHAEVVQAVGQVRRSTGRDVRLRLVGSGPRWAMEQLRAVIQAEQAACYVDLVGEVDRSALLDEYQRADLFVFASASETFGVALLEAMGARLPIACSNRTGLSDILQDAGVYFDPAHPAEIAAAMQQLITSTALRQQLGERAFDYARAYTWERCACETFDFIRQVAGAEH